MTGLALINLFGVKLSISIMLIRSLTILSILAKPTLNLFWINSPTALTRYAPAAAASRPLAMSCVS